MRQVTINAGMVMRAWYDVLALEGPRREDADGIRDSAGRVDRLIAREEARGVPAARIVLAGFSQGGAIALHVGVRHATALGGLLALSTYLPLASTVADEATAAGRRAAVFMAHGTGDPLIPLARARASRDALRGLGCAVEWREFPMGHAVCGEEIEAIAAWLAPRLAGPRAAL
jgi:phospholipase/carboxylesterase